MEGVNVSCLLNKPCAAMQHESHTLLTPQHLTLLSASSAQYTLHLQVKSNVWIKKSNMMWATFSKAQYYWYCTVLKAMLCGIKMEYIGISYVEITSVKAYAEWGTNEQHW
jgi:hypothetical protein